MPITPRTSPYQTCNNVPLLHQRDLLPHRLDSPGKVTPEDSAVTKGIAVEALNCKKRQCTSQDFVEVIVLYHRWDSEQRCGPGLTPGCLVVGRE
jgi:hypothetical protein